MTNSDRREVIAWIVAGVLVVVGAITAGIGMLTPVSFGWFAYQPLANATLSPTGDAVLLSRTTVISLVVLAIGLLAVAFLTGWRLATKRTR